MSDDTENDSSLSAFTVSIVINSVVGICTLVAFTYLRSRKSLEWCYLPTRKHHQRWGRDVPQAPPLDTWNWFKHIFYVSEEDIFKQAGLDGLMLLRFFILGVKIFAACAAVGMIILIPINSLGDADLDDMGKLTMANVDNNDNSLWAHLIFAYILFGYLYYLIYQEYQFVVEKRHECYLLHPSNSSRFTALYTDIPEEYMTSEALTAYLAEIYPNEIHSVTFVRQTKDLMKLVNERECKLHKLERFSKLYDLKKEIPQTKTSLFTCKKVDALDYFSAEIERLNEEIATMTENEAPNFPSAIVSFRSVSTKYRATALPHSSIPYELDCIPAPAADDIVWSNLEMRNMEKQVRQNAINFSIYVMMLFYMIPIAFVSSLSSLSSITETFPFLKPILDSSPVVQGFLEGFLPSLAFIIFMAILPIILKQMALLQGCISMSGAERVVFTKFYQFQVTNFFLATIIAGSLLNELDAFVNNPSSIVSLLAESVPQFSSFFINFIMLAAFSQWPLKLIRAPALILGSLKKNYMTVSDYEVEEAVKAPPLEYGQEYPMYLLMFLIGLTYCVISPLVSPFALMYFVIGYIITKNQLIYVFDPTYESGGKLYPLALKRILGACLIAQLTLIGVFALKESPVLSTLSIPLAASSYLLLRQIRKSFTLLEDFPLQKDLTNSKRLDDESMSDDSIHCEIRQYISPGLDAASLNIDQLMEKYRSNTQPVDA